MLLTVDQARYEPCRIFCVGMNYTAHIRELRNEIPESPVIFMKPATSLVEAGTVVRVPPHGKDLHYETEVVVLIGKESRPRTDAEARAAIAGVSLGLDLTLRDVQTALRKKGLPWEFSKAFEQSAPVTPFIPFGSGVDLGGLEFECRVNGEVRQRGHTKDMVFSIPALICSLARVWTLRPGDLLYTGTPEGVGSLKAGDRVEVAAPWLGQFAWEIGPVAA